MLERITRDLELGLQYIPTHEGLLYMQDVPPRAYVPA